MMTSQSKQDRFDECGKIGTCYIYFYLLVLQSHLETTHENRPLSIRFTSLFWKAYGIRWSAEMNDMEREGKRVDKLHNWYTSE